MASDPTVVTKVQKLDNGDRLVIAAGGTLEIETGAVLVGLAPKIPASDGKYVLQIASGVATWVAETP